MGVTPARRQVLSYLKWVGGKTRYASALASLAPPAWDGVYREPFVGSAAVFFEVRPEQAHLTDANPELVVCHQQVAEDPHTLMDLLDVMPKTKEFFYEVRAQDPLTLTRPERAARLIYLNKQCFRGLWRVNRRGEFNVPWGGYGDSRALYDRDVLLRSSKVLQAATVAESDFTEALDSAGPGDFVFCDPPYVPLGGWADFKRYTAGQFHEPDHRQLEASMRAAVDRGAHVMMTNSNTDLVREIWSEWHIREMATIRDININTAKRGSSDLIVTSYEVTPANEQLTLG